MSVLIVDKVSHGFGGRQILDDASFRLNKGEHVALVGANGEGKSTFLNIITGNLMPDAGTVSWCNHITTGYLDQRTTLSPGKTIREVLREAFAHFFDLEKEMLEAYDKMATADDEEMTKLMEDAAEIQDILEHSGFYTIDAKIEEYANGLGLGDIGLDKDVSELSGGQRSKVLLTKLLLEDPDLLMLDEPTNHLDFKTLTWLEDYLTSYKGAILTVSHDRYFLDKIVNVVCEMENKTIVRYNAGYTKYIDLKAARLARMQKEYDRQMAEIAKLEDFIAKNKVRASTTKRAHSREMELEHMELKERPTPPPKPPKFRFTYEREPVKDVLIVENLRLEAGEGSDKKLLCPSVNLEVRRGEKIALVGMNGVGKSTFIKTILGILPNESGIIEWGRNVRTGYYDQHNSYLTGSKTMLDEMWDMFPRSDELTLRTALGRARLVGDNVFKKIDVLSGGEKARLSFAALTLKDANVLVLDEPTNHMDISCKEALDEALREYTGTIIMVSHDRYLLNRVPTRIIEMFPDRLVSYNGVYDDYLRLKEDLAPAPKEEKKPSQNETVYYRSKQQKSEDAKRRNRIKAVENEISACDDRIGEIEAEMTKPEICSDYEKMAALCSEIEELKNKQNALMDEWAELTEE